MIVWLFLFFKSNNAYVLETLQTNKYTAIKATNRNNDDAYKSLIL